ncbi:MAG: hypothetical protein JSV32_04660 [Dehalococcoidia bacterium]|nr:MAG: hypothetical protein JSV32_04660 [Dehalococcoidia bacterium]
MSGLPKDQVLGQRTFGALLLGYYNDTRNLIYAGNLGSGFDEETLLKLKKKLEDIRTNISPLTNAVELTASITWVKPEVVVEAKFSEWTRAGRLRAPVFLRLRNDKTETSVYPVKTSKTNAKLQEKTNKIQTDSLSYILEQLVESRNKTIIEVGEHKISLNNLDREFWPRTVESGKLNKRDFITYLVKISPFLLPHLKNRPLTLSRYPNGIYGQHFFQKHYWPVPAFVDTVLLSFHDAPSREYLMCNNLSTLIWLGQIANIELHTWFSRIRPGIDFKVKTTTESADFFTNYPDFIIFDIDPYIYSGSETFGAEPELNRAAFEKTCQIALKMKEVLDHLSLPSFVKTSGQTGLHIFIPIFRQLDFDSTLSSAEIISRFILNQNLSEVSIEWTVEKRKDKIFIDYKQNARGKTLASIYSPRPSPQARVSIPLRWTELNKVYPTDFTIMTIPDRLAKVGDLWGNILEAKVDIVNMLSKIKSHG